MDTIAKLIYAIFQVQMLFTPHSEVGGKRKKHEARAVSFCNFFLPYRPQIYVPHRTTQFRRSIRLYEPAPILNEATLYEDVCMIATGLIED